MFTYLQNRDVYIQDCFAGADENYRLPVPAEYTVTISKDGYESFGSCGQHIDHSANSPAGAEAEYSTRRICDR